MQTKTGMVISYQLLLVLAFVEQILFRLEVHAAGWIVFFWWHVWGDPAATLGSEWYSPQCCGFIAPSSFNDFNFKYISTPCFWKWTLHPSSHNLLTVTRLLLMLGNERLVVPLLGTWCVAIQRFELFPLNTHSECLMFCFVLALLKYCIMLLGRVKTVRLLSLGMSCSSGNWLGCYSQGVHVCVYHSLFDLDY